MSGRLFFYIFEEFAGYLTFHYFWYHTKDNLSLP